MNVEVGGIYRYWVWPHYFRYGINLPGNVSSNINVVVQSINEDGTLTVIPSLVAHGERSFQITPDMLKECYYVNDIVNGLTPGVKIFSFGNTPEHIFEIVEFNLGENRPVLARHIWSASSGLVNGNTHRFNLSDIAIIPNDILHRTTGLTNTVNKPSKLDSIFKESKYKLELLEFYYDPNEPKKKQFRKEKADSGKKESVESIQQGMITGGIDPLGNPVNRRTFAIGGTTTRLTGGTFITGTPGAYGIKNKESKLDKEANSKMYKQYCLVINSRENVKSFFTKIDDKIVYLKNKNTNVKQGIKYEEAIKQLCTVAIKDPKESIRLFGHSNKKKTMFESCENDKKTYSITKFIFDYKCKDGSTNDVVEVFNGEVSLKFKLEDVEIKVVNTKGISLPKDRKIKEGVKCIVKNNKHLNVDKFTKITVNRISQNRPTGGRSREDERYGKTIKPSDKDFIVVGTTEDGKQINCRIRHLKRL